MSKRYRKRKSERVSSDVFKREKLINSLLADFSRNLRNMSYLQDSSNYDLMYAKKDRIKRLIEEQLCNAYKMNFRRYQFLEEHINRFKYIYVRWKKLTANAFLAYRMKVPQYLINIVYLSANRL